MKTIIKLDDSSSGKVLFTDREKYSEDFSCDRECMNDVHKIYYEIIECIKL
jgi:hypothetical protein